MRNIILLMLCFSFSSFGSDTARESRLVQEVLSGIVDGEPIFLETENKTKFLTIYTKSDLKAEGLAIILHGRGLHANWQNVTQPVRTILPEFGWDTLSLQMPVLDNNAVFNDYVAILPEAPPRIKAAIQTAQALAYKKIVLIAHSCGGQMMLHWLKQQTSPLQIDALVNISLGMDNYKRVNGDYPPLNHINIPVLDIYGSEDIVKDLSIKRWNLIRQAGNPLSKQVEVEGAEHMFIDKGEVLTKHIHQWLESL